MTRNSLARRSPSAAIRRSVRVGLLMLGFGMGCADLESRVLKPTVEEGAGQSGSSASGGGGNRGGSSNRGGNGASEAGTDAGDGGTSGASSSQECGNGHREGDEACDDGNLLADDGCDGECGIETSSATCGDGSKEGSEACDDGNQQPGDGCDARCRKEECGNSRVDAGEECDPPSAGHCTTHCIKSSARCGDGEVQSSEGEQCDDENDTAGDGCVDCRKECGDGRIESSLGEECEREYSPDHCTEQCRWAPTCGDGNVQTEIGEECDPSNGVTCVACKVTSPPSCEDGSAGCGGGDGECVPDGSSGLLQNGDFASDTSGWIAADSSIHLKSVDDGSPSPRALEVAFDESQVRAESGAYQCVPVRGGQKYELEARYKIPAGTPAGVGAAVVGFLYAGTQCKGSFVGSSLRGPQARAQDAWTAYSFQIDTAALPSDGSPARLMLRLDVVQPAGVDGSRVLWDTVLLSEPGAHCGDCHVDAGETCDDGNRTPGDGCDATCERERCGDGLRSSSEACDDGNTTYGGGDTCTPACRVASSCDVCAAGACQAELSGCFALTGEATAGPGAGLARSTLCDGLLACVQRTACDLAPRTTQGVTGAFMENCYCGTSGEHCFDDDATPNGSCRAEVTAALETTEPLELLARFDGTEVAYPIFNAVRDLLACEGASCSEPCARAATCGDHRLQDRDLDFTFIIDRKDVPCADELTASGRGCSFEECDDGNTTPGDGCDQYCFRETCGNYVVQAGEDCDDGNTTSHDGCDENCHGEFDCGNGILEPDFEDCEPPSQDGADCTEEQAETDPGSCACDASCKLVICGDGVKQSPLEQCDPPNGFSCGDDCQFLAQSPCHDCLVASAYLGELQTTTCDTDAKCTDVQNCAVEKRCFSPVAAVCWCGITDVETCRAPGFPFPPPTTPLNCVPEMTTGFDNPTSNTDAIDRIFIEGYPASPAFGILNVVNDFAPECVADCL